LHHYKLRKKIENIFSEKEGKYNKHFLVFLKFPKAFRGNFNKKEGDHV